ncbi:15015_t:CDS:2 [Acaulospora morrowiae]|uniref:DNA (cytosine-5-)-methyltransferase n=1 Tax=Acaulospora morrowiae TaxID=94023 RepID=A0A9N9GWX0_9GLOM|nr:15015_t:CDS:2 [Acaulospora morrowiae]
MFCGAGGLSEGAKQAGFLVKWGVDIDTSSMETFLCNHHSATTYNMDISCFMDKHIGDAQRVDVLLAAPPCQGFTGANTRGNIIDMTTNMVLVMNVPRAVNVLRPKVLVFENVKGFCNQKKSDEMYKLFISDLMDVGYKVETKILKASDFGVCQRRERFILLAVPTESNLPNWPKPTHFIDGEISVQTSANHIEMGLVPTPTVDAVPSTVLCTINPGWDNIHPTEFRHISPRESARLQSFSDSYVFKGDLNSQYRQVGNSVPPLLARAIMKEVRRVI